MGRQSVCAKQPLQVDPREILEKDSHRPEFVTISQGCNNKKGLEGERKGEYVERRISKTMSAFRRTESGKKITCFGQLLGQMGRCGAYIAIGVDNEKDGVLFLGSKKVPRRCCGRVYLVL